MITVRSGALITQDPNDSLVYRLNWDEENLGESVVLIGAGTITITADDEASPALEADQLALLDGNRSARVRLTGGQLGQRYRVSHRVSTNESPAQTKEQSFFVLIQNR